MKIDYTKPWLSYEQQIEQLRRCGLRFSNNDEALHILKHVQYYRLAGYLHHFKMPDPNDFEKRLDVYFDGTTFNDVFALYRFDKKLRVLLLDAIESIEIALRTQISYEMGKIDRFFFNDSGRFRTVKAFVEFYTFREKVWNKNNGEFVRHAKSKYNTYPIWVEAETWSMGCIKKCVDKVELQYFHKIVKDLGFGNTSNLQKWVSALNDIRNICAHHGRVWNFGHVPIDASNKNDKYFDCAYQSAKIERFSTSALYFQCMVIWQILKRINPHSEWNNRLYELIRDDFPQNSFQNNLQPSEYLASPLVGLRKMGFPDKWEQERFWGLHP